MSEEKDLKHFASKVKVKISDIGDTNDKWIVQNYLVRAVSVTEVDDKIKEWFKNSTSAFYTFGTSVSNIEDIIGFDTEGDKHFTARVKMKIFEGEGDNAKEKWVTRNFLVRAVSITDVDVKVHEWFKETTMAFSIKGTSVSNIEDIIGFELKSKQN